VDVAEHMAIVDDKLTNLRLAVEDSPSRPATMACASTGLCLMWA